MQNLSERRTDGEKLLKQLKEQWGHQPRYCEPTAIPRGYTRPQSATRTHANQSLTRLSR
jgi:hypothetical protein